MVDKLLETNSRRHHALRCPTNPISIGELRCLRETSWRRRIGQIQNNSSTSWTSRRDPQDPLPPLHEIQLDILNGSVPDGTTTNSSEENATNHSGNNHTTNHSGANNTIYQSGTSINHGGTIDGVLKENTFPILLVIPLLLGLMLLPRIGGGNGQGHNHVRQETSHRTPPRWGPEMEPRYSFKTYITDLQLWSMMTDLAPYQKVAAVILRLSGAAKDLLGHSLQTKS